MQCPISRSEDEKTSEKWSKRSLYLALKASGMCCSLILSLTGGAECRFDEETEFTKHFSIGTIVSAEPVVNFPRGV